MKRETVEPKVVLDSGSHVGDKVTHPAFGSIHVSRVSGGNVTLYDSDHPHQHYIEVRIHNAEFARHLSTDWHFSREEVACVHMTESQWATFVSSFGVGSGTPCTIEHVNGETRPYITLREKNREFVSEIKDIFSDTEENLKSLYEKIQSDPKLSVKSRESYLGALRAVSQSYKSSAPFVLSQFDEAMEKSVEKAKADVLGFIKRSVTQSEIVSGSEQKMVDKEDS